jgi:site-specific DNA recombinase
LRITRTTAKSCDYRKQIDEINIELIDVNRRLERLYDALETGKLELSDLAQRIQVLRQRQNQLQSAKEEIKDKITDRKIELANINIV